MEMWNNIKEYTGFYLIQETGDIVEYCGETLTDPHKGEYDSEYRVHIPGKFKKGDRLCDYELYDKKLHKPYTLIKLPKNININTLNKKSIELLYGKEK